MTTACPCRKTEDLGWRTIGCRANSTKSTWCAGLLVRVWDTHTPATGLAADHEDPHTCASRARHGRGFCIRVKVTVRVRVTGIVTIIDTYTGTDTDRDTDIQIHRYTDTQIRRYVDMQIRRYADTQIRRYADRSWEGTFMTSEVGQRQR